MNVLTVDHPISSETREDLARALFGHVIDGAVVASLDEATMDVIDPSTGSVVAAAASGSATDVDRAVQSARAAFDDRRWRDLPPLDKERRMRRLSTLLADNGDRFAELDSIDAGLLRSYTGFVVQFAIDGLDYFSGWPSKLEGSIPAVPADFAVYQLREPIGVVAMITPWNGPTGVLAMVAAAIAAGNSVVLKPAEQTPMTAVLLAELAIEAGIPPGVFNVVQGPGETVGAALVDHPSVDAISFTGSFETGRTIQASAAQRVKRVGLELGGKSPFIIFDDADLVAAAAAATAAIWGASGQVCTAGSRVLVHARLHDEFIELVVEASRDLRVGSPFDPGTQIGPLVSADQLARVSNYVRVGQEEGAELVLGGHTVGDAGYFYAPTIFTQVHNNMRIAQEEIFGPVLSVLKFGTDDEAYALANDVEYGLAAGVWTNDLRRAHRAVRALHAGTVWVNSYQMVYPTVAYGGVKLSGHGRSLGGPSMDDLTEIKTVWMKVS